MHNLIDNFTEAMKHLEAIHELAKCGCYYNYPDPEQNELAIKKHKMIEDAKDFINKINEQK